VSGLLSGSHIVGSAARAAHVDIIDEISVMHRLDGFARGFPLVMIGHPQPDKTSGGGYC